MSSEDYQLQNSFRYSRTSYNKSRKETQDNDAKIPKIINTSIEVTSGTADGQAAPSNGCNCEMDPEGEIANILHKKCPVITLAHQQLQRLLDETDNLLCDDTRCGRSIYDLFCICKLIILKLNKYQCILLALIAFTSFFSGLVVGAASCGSYLGRFDSPLLTCIDNYFIPSSYITLKDTYISIT